MFGKKKWVTIGEFGSVKYSKSELSFRASIDMFGKAHEIGLRFRDYSLGSAFTPEQEQAVAEYFDKKVDIEHCLTDYYTENYAEIIEKFYEGEERNSDYCCRTEEDFNLIVNGKDSSIVPLLISYFRPQLLIFNKNGYCALLGFLAVFDGHGIAVTIKPRLEFMTQDEYFDEYLKE